MIQNIHGKFNLNHDLPGFREVPNDYDVKSLITAFSQNDQEAAELLSKDILLLPERLNLADRAPIKEYYPDSTSSFLRFLESEKELSTDILPWSDDSTIMRRSMDTWLPIISIAATILTPIVVELVRHYLLKQGNQQDDVVHLEIVMDNRKFKYDGHIKDLHIVIEKTKCLWDK